MDRNLQDAFLTIVRLGIGHNHNAFNSVNAVNWFTLQALAERQGLAAIIVDGLERLPEDQRPPKEVLHQMIGQVLQGYEYRYDLYRRCIGELAGFYEEYGLKMMVLKGYACSLDWPKPEHRPCGDIDIWLFGKQKEADEILQQAREPGFMIDNSHHHHTVFRWRDFMVENHYDFVNVYAHNSSSKLEKIFKDLGKDDSYYVILNDERVYIPSPNLHALFLIRHMLGHFAAAEISLRQVLDWAFFVEKHTEEVDWGWLLSVLEEYHMKDFFNIINVICIDDLGFRSDSFPTGQCSPEIKERVLSDILAPVYGAEEPEKLAARIIYKIKRWNSSSWKRDLCYNESHWRAFLNGIWAKVLKPASI